MANQTSTISARARHAPIQLLVLTMSDLPVALRKIDYFKRSVRRNGSESGTKVVA